MYITDKSTPDAVAASEPRFELLNNPITYEIILMIAIVSFAMLLMSICRCIQSSIAPDDGYHPSGNRAGDEEEARPWDFARTTHGELPNNGRGGSYYGTMHVTVDDDRWYRTDGIESTYNKWVEAIYYPRD